MIPPTYRGTPRRRAPKGATLADRIAFHSVEVGSGCREWQGAISSHGYGRFQINGRTDYAHRVAYIALVGEIPEGLTIDHLCRNRRCVNPVHLEAVSGAENTRRAFAFQKEGANA